MTILRILTGIAAPIALLAGCSDGPDAGRDSEAGPISPAASQEAQAAAGEAAGVSTSDARTGPTNAASAEGGGPMGGASAAAALPGEGPADTPSSEPSPRPKPAATGPVRPPMAFIQCSSCHSVEPGKNGIGPTLHGVFGTKAASDPGFKFSPALARSGIVWNRQTLDEWLAGPMQMVPGTRMVIPVRDAQRRKEIIDYIETLQ